MGFRPDGVDCLWVVQPSVVVAVVGRERGEFFTVTSMSGRRGIVLVSVILRLHVCLSLRSSHVMVGFYSLFLLRIQNSTAWVFAQRVMAFVYGHIHLSGASWSAEERPRGLRTVTDIVVHDFNWEMHRRETLVSFIGSRTFIFILRLVVRFPRRRE